MLGTVAVWIRSKGYGFLTPNDEKLDDVFTHVRYLQGGLKRLTAGQKVRFDLTVSDRDGGPLAINVATLESASPEQPQGVADVTQG